MRIFEKIVVLISILIFSGVLFQVASTLFVQAETMDEEDGDYTYDPVISGDSSSTYKPKNPSDLTIDKRENEIRLKLQTEGQVSPYVGTGRKAPPTKGDLPLLSEEELERNKKLHLETGVDVELSERTNLNLGYRIDNSSSDLEESQDDKGQIRFGVDFRFPAK